MSNNVFEVINLAQALLAKGCTDEAEAMIGLLERKLYLLNKVEADAAADDQDDDEENGNGNGNDMEDDGDEDDGDGDVNKSFRENNITYPRSSLDYPLMTAHQNMSAPVSSPKSDSDPYALGTTDVVQRPGRHQFDDAVDRVQQRDRCSRNAAMVAARLEYPRLYDDYQRGSAMQSTAAQSTSRGYSMDVNKLGLPKTPPLYPESEHESTEEGGKKKVKSHRRPVRHHDQKVKTFEDVVANLVGKGHRIDIAKQIATHLYGATLPHAEIAKHADLRERFESRVEKIMRRDKCDRLDAMQKARLERADDYLAYQLS